MVTMLYTMVTKLYKNPYGNQPIQISIVTNLYINPHFKQHKSQWKPNYTFSNGNHPIQVPMVTKLYISLLWELLFNPNISFHKPNFTDLA